MANKRPGPKQKRVIHPTIILLVVLLFLSIISWSQLAKDGYSLADQSSILGIAVGYTTIIALIVGAVWTYWLVVQNRQTMPWAEIRHSIFEIRLNNERVLVQVKVSLKNLGTILIQIAKYETRLQQVLPLEEEFSKIIQKDIHKKGETEIVWPLIASLAKNPKLGEMEIEPGETQELIFDFVIPSDIETVSVYSYAKNEKKQYSGLAWDVTTLYNIQNSGLRRRSMVNKSDVRSLQNKPKPKPLPSAIKQQKPKPKPPKTGPTQK